MRPARAIHRVSRNTVSSQAARNLATTTKCRPVVVATARNDRQGIESSRRYLTSSSQSAASTSTSHQEDPSQSDAPKGDAAEAVHAEVDVSGLPTSTDLLEVYRGMVAQGRLAYDPEQVRIVMKLRHLLEELAEYQPPLDLLAKLPSSPFSQSRRRARWWSEKGKEKEWMSALNAVKGDEGRELVRVLTGEEELEGLTTPKGILITGPPGTGKSLILSLFFQLLPTPHKLRTHYHPFLLSLYRRVFQEMQKQKSGISNVDRTAAMEIAGKRGWRAVFAGGRWEGDEGDKGEVEEGMAYTIAKEMILEYHILYFDELQLLDASSAALLRDVLSWYWRFGGVIISCSNRVPDDLYHHGVQRDRMSSFLSALKARCEVVTLDGGKDYRRSSEGEPQAKWFQLSESGFDDAWAEVPGKEERKGLGVYGRNVTIPKAKGRACQFTFSDLCEQPLGPADYLSITSEYSTIFIDKVPVLLLKNKNEARRLINLVDALYEARCQIFIRAEAPLATLFFPDALSVPPSSYPSGFESNEAIMAAEALSETLHAPVRPNISLYDETSTEKRETGDREDRGGVWGNLGIFTGEDERFAYKRAVSRLVEMTTSPGYQGEEWKPLDPSGRTWETKINSSLPTPGARAVQDKIRTKEDLSDDLAVEAGYSRPGRLAPPPKMNSDLPTKTRESSNPGHAIPKRDTSPKSTDERVIDHPIKGPSRHSPPIIKEQHVWGVADEWGGKAGKWGQGSKAHESGGRKSGDQEDK